jgi:hypothetical protein
MLTPHQLKDNYYALLKEFTKTTGIRSKLKDDGYTIVSDKFTPEHWNNLVQVCSIIKANVNRFNMSHWHGQSHECGTTHCIAGWAESLAKGDTNYIGLGFTSKTATDVLSRNVESFFYVTQSNLFFTRKEYNFDVMGQYEGIAEQLVMKYFIDPVLEEAKKESYELSTELQQFIKKAQEDKELVSVA